MKKLHMLANLSVSLSIVLLMLSACTQATPIQQVSSDLTDGYVWHQIGFPESDAEKTDFNKDIFEVTPFNIQVALPDGWFTGEFDYQAETYLYSGVWSRIAIYDKEENCVGAVGYNTFETDEENEGELMAVYNQIALGNDYQFNVKDSYTVVKKSDVGETATVDVYYSPVLLNFSDSESDPKINFGVLSYNSDKSVYVAFEFDSSVTDETIANIANSIEFID